MIGVQFEGNLLAADITTELLTGNIKGQTPADFGLPKSDKLLKQNLLVYFVWCCGWCYHLCNLGFRDGIYEWDSRDRNWFSYHHLLSDLWTFMYLSVKVLLLIRISKNGNSCQDLISQLCLFKLILLLLHI